MAGIQVLRASSRIWIVAMALAGLLLAATAASADSGEIRFRGTAAVRSLQVLGTTSTFDYARDGSIKRVNIATLGEIVFADDLQVECKPKNSPACQALGEARLTDTHTSQEVLRDVELVPNPFSALLGMRDAGALAGKLSGDLSGDLLVSKDTGAIPGKLAMKIRGSATLSCVVPNPVGPIPPVVPVPVAACEDKNGDGQPDLGGFLIPVVFEVDDQGRFELGAGTGIFEGISGGEGRLRAAVAGNVKGQSGTISINDGTLNTGSD